MHNIKLSKVHTIMSYSSKSVKQYELSLHSVLENDNVIERNFITNGNISFTITVSFSNKSYKFSIPQQTIPRQDLQKSFVNSANSINNKFFTSKLFYL